MKNYIKGTLQKIIYDNGNGYIIGKLKIKETNDEELEDYVNKSMTFTGYFESLNENTAYILYGNIVNHPKYGLQYQVLSYEYGSTNTKYQYVFLYTSINNKYMYNVELNTIRGTVDTSDIKTFANITIK